MQCNAIAMHVCNAYIYICTVYICMYIYTVYTYIYIHISELDQGLVSIRFMQHSESTGSVEKDTQVVSALKSEFLLHKTRQCERKNTPIKGVKRKSPHEPDMQDMHNTWRHIYIYIHTDTHILYWYTRHEAHTYFTMACSMMKSPFWVDQKSPLGSSNDLITGWWNHSFCWGHHFCCFKSDFSWCFTSVLCG